MNRWLDFDQTCIGTLLGRGGGWGGGGGGGAS